MKAIIHTKYGSPYNLKLQEIDKPFPRSNEVLIKVHASSVNSYDWDIITGKPLIYRLMFGLTKPNINQIGCDVAGIVEAKGSDVTQFEVGDEVLGDLSQLRFSTFAEYVCATENFIAKKPINASFEQAAGIPHAAVLALQALQNIQEIKPEHHILINGAGGSVGPFALQLAKLKGAKVTCVDSEQKLNLLQSLGADYVIDYKKDDFTKNGKQYDLIIETVIKRSVFKYRKSLTPNGILVIVGGKVGKIIQTVVFGSLLAKVSNKKYGLLIHKPNSLDLKYLVQLFEEGKLHTVIDKTYPLNETANAMQYYGEGKAKGKIIIKIC